MSDLRPAHFRHLWVASSAGALADGLAATALPLLLVQLTRDPVQISLLQVASGLPWLLLGLHAGVLADRWDRRRILWGSDLVRAAVVAVLVLLVVTGRAGVAAILVVALVYAAATVLFRAASSAVLPSLVLEDDLARANGRLQAGTTTTGSLVGPGLGGLLWVVAAWVPLLTQLISLLVSVLVLLRLPARPPRPPTTPPSSMPTPSMRADIGEGVRWVLGSPTLRALAVATTLLAASTGMLMAVLVLHVLERLEARPSSYGILFTLYAVGGLAVSLVAPGVHRRFGTRRALLASASLGALSLLAVAWATGIVLAAVGMSLLGVATMLYNVVATTVRQQLTPAHLLGRVSSTFNALGVGTLPLAAVGAGMVAGAYGPERSITLAAGLCAAAAAAVAALLRNGDLPQG